MSSMKCSSGQSEEVQRGELRTGVLDLMEQEWNSLALKPLQTRYLRW